MKKKLLHNVIYNIIGAVVPIVLVIVTVPPYLKAIGSVNFGFLSLIWLLFGYFGLFDFGLSRATANRLATLQNASPDERSTTFFTAAAINLVLGLIIGVIFYCAASPLLATVSDSGSSIQADIDRCIPFMAGLFPLALVGGVFIGSLEAQERFLLINIQQIVGGALMQCLPLAIVLIWTPTLPYAVAGAVIARVISVVWAGAYAVASYRGRPAFDLHVAKSLFKYGIWVAVTNSISPILESIDRFVIGSLLGATAVTHYSIPFSIAAKASVFPGALARTLFPRLSSLNGQDSARLAASANLILSSSFAVMCTVAVVLSEPAMNWWLGAETAKPMIMISQIIFFGIWINGVAYIPYALLQAQGRPDVVAKFHALELIPFLGVLAIFVYYAGLPGAAMAWTVRVAIDSILLLWASKTIDRAVLHYILDAIFVGAVLLIAATIGTHILADIAVLAIYGGLKFLMNARSGALAGGVRDLLAGF